ncbi:sialate O-acetylesterase [Aridibaculum aurantiacum]|uniref:sialate O-acetylesterase n=1 Tax=Aridibaculum aurantiacum TaxID=2810307 RepID=UPI001A964A63|nr:sialate O-acetylesterase [Aridibaculum aurantiacum]
MTRFLFICLLFLQHSLHAQVRLPKYYADHMILQRDRPMPIIGWAAPGNTIEVSFNNKSYKATATADSSWKAVLPKTKAGGPYTISVSANGVTKTFSDVYFGDVWLCGGQSNMNYRMRTIKNRDEELKDADYPLIRQLNIDQVAAEYPQQDIVKGQWVPASSKTIDAFTAVGFQFAKEVYKHEKVPIGIIHASWGGSPIQAWMSAADLQDFPNEIKKINRIHPGFIAAQRKQDSINLVQWEKNIYAASAFVSPAKQLQKDPSFFADAGWKQIVVPGYLQDQDIKVKKGISWFKRNFHVEPAFLQDTIAANFGRINFASAFFINGNYIGSQLNPYYNASFKFPAQYLHAGDNEIIVLCFNESESTGFRPVSKPHLRSGASQVELSGNWLFRQGKTFDTAGAMGPMNAVDFVNSYPTLAFNAMIHPLRQYPVKGFLWYQGEGNTGAEESMLYENMLTRLIGRWRQMWGNDKLPFLMVQISSYGAVKKEPVATGWPVVQEAQANIARTIPNTGIAITNDVGNAIDVHPDDKQTVGKRLAAVALNKVYGHKKMVAAGPTYHQMEIKDGKAILSFKNIGSGIVSKTGTGSLRSFAIAGADNRFYRAEAVISGNKVIVSSNKVPAPLHVRYAFENTPPAFDFYNKEGFPAVPFRTDKLQDFLVKKSDEQ